MSIEQRIVVIDKTKPRFAMFEPITFPKAISACPSIADLMLTISSGAEVANETIVIPIIILGICIRFAKHTADFKRKSPPKTNKKSPDKMKNISIITCANLNIMFKSKHLYES